MRVLVIDDSPGDRRLVALALEEEGVEVVTARDARDGRETLSRCARDGGLDAILLDIRLPDQSGLELLRELRDEGWNLPILMITGHEESEIVSESLECGADDHVKKSWDTRELVARMMRCITREPRSLQFGDLALDLERQLASGSRGRIELSATEFCVLAALVRARGRPVGRAEFAREVWRLPPEDADHAIDCALARLRSRLHRRSRARIENVRGIGWRLGVR